MHGFIAMATVDLVTFDFVSRCNDICAPRFVIDDHMVISILIVCDLGVNIASELSFYNKISKIVSNSFV
jgi:hypothetical protein